MLQQIVWLDCCYSGALLDFNEGDPGNTLKRKRCFIAACRAFQVAYQQFNGNHGVFSGALLEGLNPENHPDGLVTNHTLEDFIQQQLKNVLQHPMFIRSQGEIILTAKLENIHFVLNDNCPYKGRSYFDFHEENEEDAQFFHGRQELINRLLEKVGAGNFLAVLGPSGSGKSSVVRAGLLSQLRHHEKSLRHHEKLRGSHEWAIRIFQPGKNPSQSLAAVFPDSIEKIDAPRMVLVADEFQEVFTECKDDAERQDFFGRLLGAVDRFPEKLRLVLVMRADFLGKCLEFDYAGLGAKIEKHLVTVPPMSPEELKDAITKPAEQVGLVIEEELVKTMLDDVEGSPGSLPLLQDVLCELWEKRELDRVLTLASYGKLGGVKEALKKRADEVYKSLESDAEREVAKQIFIQLTHLGEGPEYTRRQVSLKDLVPNPSNKDLVERVIKKLADKKLIVTTGKERSGGKEGDRPEEAVVDVAHEALIRHWDELHKWLDKNRDAVRQKRRIEAEAEEWLKREKPQDYLLLNELKLKEAERFREKYAATVPLSELGLEFVQKSRQERDRLDEEAEKQKARELKLRRDRREMKKKALEDEKKALDLEKKALDLEKKALDLEKKALQAAQTITIVAFVAAIAALIAAIFASFQWRRAQRDATISTLREKATKAAILLYTPQPVDGLVLAIQATGESQSKLQEVLDPVQSSLLSAIQIAREQNIFEGHEKPVNSVAFNPKEPDIVVSGSADKPVRLWNVKSDKQKGATFEGHEDSVTSVAFSPDGESIVSSSLDKTVRLWNLQGTPIGSPFKGQKVSDNPVVQFSSVAFSPDGKSIVSGNRNGTVRLWDLNGTQKGSTFGGNEGIVTSVAFSPDGKYIASGTDNNEVWLWNPEGEAVDYSFRGHKGMVKSVAFSPDSKYIASGSLDKKVLLWNIEGERWDLKREPIASFVGHEFSVYSVAFSSDGQYIVSGSADKTVRLSNLEGKPIGSPFVGHERSVTSVAVSPDGKSIVSGSEDKTVRLWDLKGELIGSPFVGHGNRVTSVAVSLDGKSIVSGSWDNTVRLWDLKGELIGAPFKEHNNSVTSVAFSPDGQYIVSGSADKTVRLWNVKDDEQKGSTFEGHADSVTSVAFSSDGQYIVSGSADKTVRLWNVKGDKQKGSTFEGHKSSVISVAFSPNGESIVSVSDDGNVRLWNVKEDKPTSFLFEGHKGEVVSVAFSPDSKSIVSGSKDGLVRLWNLKGDEQKGSPFVGHKGAVTSVAFSHDGKYIVSGSKDNTVRLWDLKGEPIGSFFVGDKSSVSSVAFSRDGQYIVSGSEDGLVRLWRFGWKAWLQVGCDRLRYHPILNDPEILKNNEEALGARETCEKYVHQRSKLGINSHKVGLTRPRS